MTMTLNETQRQQVADWLAAGANVSKIQNRLGADFGLNLTYLEVRLLVDDLKLTPKDPEPPEAAAPFAASPGHTPVPGAPEEDAELLPPEPPPGKGGVSVAVDKLTRPGAIVSGKATFSDGQQADWYLDQTGRLGVIPKQQGYKPSPVDVREFQTTLQGELAKLGF